MIPGSVDSSACQQVCGLLLPPGLMLTSWVAGCSVAEIFQRAALYAPRAQAWQFAGLSCWLDPLADIPAFYIQMPFAPNSSCGLLSHMLPGFSYDSRQRIFFSVSAVLGVLG
ncbi:unnamed protein product [Prorocentrum cordatum]|uniref:Mannosyltransferase n=1 Tax=Prorocentrum cordatum TaxID=2364126 RepID=A0ABN9UDF4_9DINO|nr:unnamed protein product [Polarella glacialis]